jgi:hypothetical protein
MGWEANTQTRAAQAHTQKTGGGRCGDEGSAELPRVFSVSDEHDNTVRAGNPEIPTQMEEFDE